MKKLLTLFMTVCMLIACLVPAGAVSFEVEGILMDYELGTPTTLDFSSSVGGFTKRSGEVEVNSNVLRAYKETGSSSNINFYNSTQTEPSTGSGYCLFSFEIKMVNTTEIKIRLGSGYSNGSQYAELNLETSGNINAYHSDLNDSYKTIKGKYTPGEWTKIDILTDSINNKYYAWFNNDSEDVLNEKPDIDGFAYMQDDVGYIKTIRIWTGTTFDEDTAAELLLDNYSVTPLVKSADILPSKGENNYVWNEDFDEFPVGSYTDNSSNEVWSNLVTEGVLSVPSGASGNPVQVNTGDLSIASAGEHNNHLEVTYAKGNYHNWYYPTVATNPENNMVISLKVKANGEAHIRLGSGNNTSSKGCPVILKADANGVYTIVNSEDSAKLTANNFVHKNATTLSDIPYTNITFLVHSDYTYTLWVDNELILTKEPFNRKSAINSLCFYIKENVTMCIDDIEIYEAADDDFLKVYNLMNELNAGTKAAVSTADGSIVLKNAAELGTSATVSYSDAKGYVANGDVKYPLFTADTTDIRAVVQSGAVKEAKVYQGIAVPTAYTFGETATFTKNGTKYDVSVPVSLRNELSDGRLLVVTAVYDENECKKVSIKEDAFANYNGGTFDASIELGETIISENAKVKVFFWEKGTLTPLMVYEK